MLNKIDEKGNSGDRNSGHFNTNEPNVRMFNKDTGLKSKDIQLPQFLNNLELNIWVNFDSMTNEEKKQYPNAYVLEGYLKQIPYKEAWKNLWEKATQEEKKSIEALPNFDANIFFEITGINIKTNDKKKELLAKADELIAKANELKKEAENF